MKPLDQERYDLAEQQTTSETDSNADYDLGDNNLYDNSNYDNYDSFDSMGLSAPIDRNNDLFKQLTNFSPFLKIMVADWLGMVWNDKEGKYLEDPTAKPLMNILGARWCVNFLRVYTRDNNIITNIDKDEYADIKDDIIETSWLNIGTRSEEFGIKEDGDILKVCNQLYHAAILVLMGAGGMKTYSDLLTSTTQRSESVHVDPNRTQENQGRGSGWLDKARRIFR